MFTIIYTMNDFCESRRMHVLPAIDLLQGEAVRLYQGSYDDVKSYARDPLTIVERFAVAGARFLHLVDLDAARQRGNERRQDNRDLIKKICRASPMKVEVGGGIRSVDDVKELVDIGVQRLIIGTLLVRDPELVAGWVQRFEAEFVAGIDARDGEVQVSGWENASGIRDEDLAADVANLGMKGIVYTNISRDGTLQGPDIDGSFRIARASGLPVTISGGMGNMEDCRRIAKAVKQVVKQQEVIGKGCIEGVIIGKALYEGSIDLKEAIAVFE